MTLKSASNSIVNEGFAACYEEITSPVVVIELYSKDVLSVAEKSSLVSDATIALYLF